MSALTSRVDEIDVQVERLARLIDVSQQIDREMAYGHGCSEPIAAVQSRVDQASAAVESLDRDLRKWKSGKAK